MAKSANIFSNDWCDIIFELKNKDYGAFIIRKTSDRRHFISIVIGCLLFSLAVSMPTIIKNIIPEKKKDMSIDKTILDIINKQKEDKKDEPKPIIPEEQEIVRKTIQFVIPKADETAKEEDSLLTQKQLQEKPIEIGAVNNLKGDDSPIDPSILTDKPKVIDNDVDVLVDINGVEVKPDFPGGIEKLYEYLGKNINYPEYERDNDISGTVYIQFEVAKDGKIKDVQIVRSVSKNIDDEAMRVVRSMPAWIPGKQNGRPVRVKFILPVKFTLAKH